MSKVIDFVVFSACYFLVVYGLINSYVGMELAIVITLLSYVGISLVLLCLTASKRVKSMKADEMPVYLALMDRIKQTELFFSLVPENDRISLNSPYFLFQNGDKKVLVAVLYRFINLTQEDIAGAYREATKCNADEIIMLTRARERKTLTLTALLPIKFSFPDRYTVHRALKKHNALPPKPVKPQKVKIKMDKGQLLDEIFATKRIKYLLFIALVLALMSFITPLKSYYLIMATLPLLIVVISLLKNVAKE